MLTRAQWRTACIVTTTGITTTATGVTTGSTGTTRLCGTGHSPRRLRTARHGRARRTKRSARASAHSGLLLTGLRLSDPLGELWIWRNDRPAGLRLGRAEALSATLQGRTALLRRPRHRRRTRSYPGAIASQRLIGLWARHRHARSTGCCCSGCRRRARSSSAALWRNNLTRPRSKRNSLRWAGRLRSGAKGSARGNLGSWHHRAGTRCWRPGRRRYSGARSNLHCRSLLHGCRRHRRRRHRRSRCWAGRNWGCRNWACWHWRHHRSCSYRRWRCRHRCGGNNSGSGCERRPDWHRRCALSSVSCQWWHQRRSQWRCQWLRLNRLWSSRCHRGSGYRRRHNCGCRGGLGRRFLYHRRRCYGSSIQQTQLLLRRFGMRFVVARMIVVARRIVFTLGLASTTFL